MPGPEAASDRGEGGAVHRLPGRGVEVAGFFDDFADTFDRAYGTRRAGGRVLRGRLEAVLELLPDAAGEVLDAGMGGGILCRELDRRGWSVAGIDVSRRMVELAHARLPHLSDRLVQGSILALPYDEASFDAAVALEFSSTSRRACLPRSVSSQGCCVRTASPLSACPTIGRSRSAGATASSTQPSAS